MKFRDRKEFRRKRHLRLRKRVQGTAERPRLAVMVSNRNFYVQFIDDQQGTTLASVSTLGLDGSRNVGLAKEFGKKVAEAAQGTGIKQVVVDRGGFKFHGRLKAIVDGMVESGISIGLREEK